MSTKYKFRVVLKQGKYIVQCTTGYSYGENPASFRWMNAAYHPDFNGFFDGWYDHEDEAIEAVQKYRGDINPDGAKVLWEEPEEEEEDDD